MIAALRKPAPPPDPEYDIKLQERFPWLSSLVAKVMGVREPEVTLGNSRVRVAGVLDTMLNDPYNIFLTQYWSDHLGLKAQG